MLYVNRFCILLLCIVSATYTFAQDDDAVTELKSKLKVATSDTLKLKILAELVESINDDSEWPAYNDEALELALTLSKSEVKEIEKAGLIGLATAYNNKGFDAINKGDVIKGLDLYQKSLAIYQQQGDKGGEANELSNIGFVYFEQNDFNKAEEYYLKSLALFEKSKNNEGIGNCLNNLGGLYYTKKDYPKAKEIYDRSYDLRKSEGNKIGMAYSLHNIGSLYFEEKKFNEALKYFQEALRLRREINHVMGISLSMTNISSTYFYMNELNKSLIYADSAYYYSKILGYPESISKAALVLNRLYRQKGDYKTAIQFSDIYHEMKDSIFNSNTQKEALTKQMAFEKKLESIQREKEDERKQLLLEEEKKKQKLVLGFILLVLITVSIFSFFLYKRYRLTRKQKDIIELQKKMDDEKSRKITDSIRYAKRIQNTMFASHSLLEEHIGKENYFVLFQPKDIVSGDFYYANHKITASDDIERLYLAVCDSTGHGVPGAFMSLLNITFLNEAINDHGILRPDEILNYVRERLIEGISKDGAQDGMDGAILCFEKNISETHYSKLTYAGAHCSPVIVRNGELRYLESDKMPVGKWEKTKPFTLHKPNIEAGDVFYIASDGFTDQMGGESGKKFMRKSFYELILKVQEHSLVEQENKLLETFSTWKGRMEQTDDVCVMGFRFDAN